MFPRLYIGPVISVVHRFVDSAHKLFCTGCYTDLPWNYEDEYKSCQQCGSRLIGSTVLIRKPPDAIADVERRVMAVEPHGKNLRLHAAPGDRYLFTIPEGRFLESPHDYEGGDVFHEIVDYMDSELRKQYFPCLAAASPFTSWRPLVITSCRPLP